MTSRDKFIERVKTGNRTIQLAEADKFLLDEGFRVRRTKHTYLFSRAGHRITFNAHYKTLHPKAVKELRELFIELGIIQ